MKPIENPTTMNKTDKAVTDPRTVARKLRAYVSCIKCHQQTRSIPCDKCGHVRTMGELKAAAITHFLKQFGS